MTLSKRIARAAKPISRLLLPLCLPLMACSSAPAASSEGASWDGSQSAAAIFQAGLDARAALHSVRVVATGSDRTGAYTLEVFLDGTGNGRGSMSGPIRGKNISLQYAYVGGRTYLQGRDFIAAEAGTVAGDRAGNRWLEVTPITTSAGNPFRDFSDLDSVRQCLLDGPHGTLTKGGQSQVDGYPTVTIDDRGDKPGSARARYFVATAAPHYMVRIDEMGAVLPGGPAASTTCRRMFASALASGLGAARVDLLDINSVAPIAAPPGAVDIQAVLGT